MRTALAVSTFLCLCFALGVAFAAGPASQWGHDEETSAWFRGLRSPQGFPCCDYSDGTRVEDPGDYTENDDGSYDVHVGQKTVHVPKDHVVTATNRVGYAIIWIRPGSLQNDPQPSAYCFMPGART